MAVVVDSLHAHGNIKFTDTARDMRGIEVCGEKEVVVTRRAQLFEWEGYGLKLNIQESSLPADMDQMIIKISASIAGQYEFPVDSNLVSAVYWFHCEPPCEFEKPVTVEMQHCAKNENTSYLHFVRALGIQENNSYTFARLEGGQFNNIHSRFGAIDVGKFCGLASVQTGSQELEYRASIFYLRDTVKRLTIVRDIRFIVTLDTDVHTRVSIKLIPF